jgi:hypothetical protein
VIQVRALWQEEKEKPLRVGLPVVYDETGTAFCYDTVRDPPVKRPLACIGLGEGARDGERAGPGEARGPALPEPGEVHRGEGVRADGAGPVRRRPATLPGHWPCDAAVRAALPGSDGGGAGERPAEGLWGVDDGNVNGARRFHAQVGVVRVVHRALARWLAMQPRWEGGPLGQMNLSPIAQALAQLDQEHDKQTSPQSTCTGTSFQTAQRLRGQPRTTRTS